MLGSHLASEWGSAIGKGTGAMSFLAVKGHRRLGAFMQKGVELDQENALAEIFWYWRYRRDSRHPLNHGSGVSICHSLRASGGLAGHPQRWGETGKGKGCEKEEGALRWKETRRQKAPGDCKCIQSPKRRWGLSLDYFRNADHVACRCMRQSPASDLLRHTLIFYYEFKLCFSDE